MLVQVSFYLSAIKSVNRLSKILKIFVAMIKSTTNDNPGAGWPKTAD
jgi:hypothetical protein